MTPNVNGSKGPIPKRRAESHRERYGTCASCKNTRQRQDHNLPGTSRMTSPRCAPRATRIPISCVRCRTQSDVTP
jgi:hypothetical protein